ncbi:HSF-type DNA-binding-domain-containing protein [Scheffersomyces xylosifermentans]|uniref:HSF-type DNA-binding-domain-containing protein n=1 Tax=Scheffersomyces xylosifermentans TaxID=1304137 RepID=UPI00315DE31D
MSHNFDEERPDPIVELLNTHPNGDNDIQVIHRDDPFGNDNASISNNGLFVGDGTALDSTGFTPLNESLEAEDPVDDENDERNRDHHNQHQTLGLESPTGMTPMLAPVQDFVSHPNNQLAYINKPNFITPLPPLAPLSESVLPNGININPLAFNNKISNDLGTDNRKTLSTTSSSVIPSNSNNINNKKKKEPTGPKTRPLFVTKIWAMVNDVENQEYIRWNDDGKTFQVFHREEFMKFILPKYFKHSNFASFVRQLNMYGWHKVQDINSGTLNQGKTDKGIEEVWQFENPNFIRDREDLLDKIIRNKSSTSENEGADSSSVNFQIILNELDQIKMNQLAIGEDLRRIRKDNKTLWNENYLTRERNQQQAQTLDKILKFLVAVYGNSAGKILEVDNGPDYLDSQMTAYNPQQPASPNPYSQQGYGPFQKPMLMLTNQAHRRSPSGSSYKSPRQSTSQAPMQQPQQNIQRSTSGHHRNSSTTDSDSIEEIIRSYGNTPRNGDASSNNVNRIYQQIINQGSSVASPRHYFPELNNAPSPYVGPSTPNQQFLRVATPAEQPSNDTISGLEQNIYKQGQSIQQVQDWIQRLASQQQQQQSSINEINDEIKHELDSFDVNEFLNSNNTNSSSDHNTSQQGPVASADPNTNKRPIQELYDEIEHSSSKKRK